MELRPGDFDKYVDTVLKHFNSGEKSPINDAIDLIKDLPTQNTERHIFRDFLLDEGLIRIVAASTINPDNPYCRITPKGYKIFNSGGWKEYIKHSRELEKLKNDLVNSSITASKVSVRTNRATIAILIVTVLISGVGACISWLNYDFVKTHQEPSRRTIDSLSNRLLERQTETLQDLRKILNNDSLDKNLKVKK